MTARILERAVVMGVLLIGGACKKNATPPNASPFIDILITPANAALPPGNTVTLKATVRGPAQLDQRVTWMSLDTEIATVTSQGLVRAVAEGDTRVRATWVPDGTVYAEADIQVTSTPNGDEAAVRAAVKGK